VSAFARTHSPVADFEEKVKAAEAAFDRNLFRSLLSGLVSTPSPSGEERGAAEFAADFMDQHGLEGEVQLISETQANALGRLPSKKRTGPSLLIYGGLDTHIGYGEAASRWVADPYPQVLKPEAVWSGDEVSGLCADNPKGLAACAAMAGICLARSGVEFDGDITVGLGAGGMPTLSRPGFANRFVGHGVGAVFMLERGVSPDYCIFCKPRYTVSWEEVGICIFRVTVVGGITYTGTRHAVPHYANPIPKVARVIDALEAWFPKYTKKHAANGIVPQGAVASILGGTDYTPIAAAGRVELLVDLRVTARSTPAKVQRELQECLDRIMSEHPDIKLQLELALAMPGAATPKESWIVQSMIRAWEATEHRSHEDLQNFSGYTDASIIRRLGIPTARLGTPPRARPADPTDTMPMNRMHIDDAQKLVNVIVRAAIDTCCRPFAETEC
jgi:succinyl-diaminopimelate desuccinylase